MKSYILLVVLAFNFLSFSAWSQKSSVWPKITPAGKGIVNTKIDNIGYWQDMARKGYIVPIKPTPARKAIPTSSILHGEGVRTQNSADIPVTSLTNTTQSENSIFIDPENEEVLLNSNNSSDWVNNYANEMYGADALSGSNSGISWMGSIFGAGNVNKGDPSTAIGRNGYRYIGKISNGGGQNVAVSKDQGKTWQDIQVGAGPQPSGYGILDKNHMWIDNSPTSTFEGNVYCAWTNLITGAITENQVMLVRSTNNGKNWSSPYNLSFFVNAGKLNHGVNLHTGPNGQVYAAWSIYDTWPSDETAIGFIQSIDGGGVFLPAKRIISNIRGIRTTLTAKNMRVNSFPSMAVDISNGPNRGFIYVVWANVGVPGINSGNDIDIYLIRSIDGGDNWSAPIRVNQDPTGLGKQHFFPWITCDPVTGYLCVVYYDDRNVAAAQCETWVSYSYDGGLSWSDMKVSDVIFTPAPIPGMAMSYFGDYIGIQMQNLKVYPIWTDNRGGRPMSYVSPFDLNPAPNQPYLIYYSNTLEKIGGGSQQNMNFGDSLYLSLGLKNIGDEPAANVIAYLSSTSPYIQITDSVDNFGEISFGEIKTMPNGYSFKVSDTIPDATLVRFNLRITGNDTTWHSHFSLESHAPALKFSRLNINDSSGGNNNGRLDPGETVEIVVTTTNTGDFECMNTFVRLACVSPYIVIHSDSSFLDTLLFLQTKEARFMLSVSDEAPIASDVDLQITGYTGHYAIRQTFREAIGLIVEDWETGDFSKFPWLSAGTLPWTITDKDPSEGLYCAQSAVIADGEQTTLTLSYTSAIDDSISFYCKTSTEADFDSLSFFIDDLLQESWSGEQSWQRFAYDVNAGSHVFKWTYYKDPYMSYGQDKAWLDFIAFPPPLVPTVNAGPDDSICQGSTYQLQASASDYDSLHWSTTGDGVFDSLNNLTPVYTPGAQDKLSGSVILTLTAFNANGSSRNNMILTLISPPDASIIVVPNDTLCAGQTATLSVDTAGNIQYFWTPGGFTSSSITVDTSQTGGMGGRLFKVRLTSKWGCQNSDSTAIFFKDCTGIEEAGDNFTCLVYPNPNNGLFTVEIRSPEPEMVDLTLISQLNVPVFSENQISAGKKWKRMFDFTDLPSGIYMLTIQGTIHLFSVKIVIRK